MFALILPESPAGERAMGQLLRMTDGTAKVFTFQLGALKADLHAAGYTIRKRSAISHQTASLERYPGEPLPAVRENENDTGRDAESS